MHPPSRLRILVAHNVPLARNGGMSRIMGFIHDRLAARGHRVDYFTADDVPARWRNAAGRRFAFQWLVREAAVAAARSGRPYDIVNVHEPHAPAVVLSRSAAGRPAVVVTSHGLEAAAWALTLEEARQGRLVVPLKTRIGYPVISLWPARLALRSADHVFCLSSDDRQASLRLGARGVTRIFPGADTRYAAAPRDYARTRRILFAAAWRHNKGIADLVPAFVTLADRHPALELAVVGPGVPAAEIYAAFPAAVRHRIMIETPPDEAAMAAAFSASDLFVLPSLFEGTPLTLVQAMMSGLPIVTTATCGMKDVIADGETGCLIPMRSPSAIVETVERLLSDSVLRQALGRSAQSAALAQHTWDRVALPVEEVYLRLRQMQSQWVPAA